MKKVKLLFILISVLFSTGCSSVSKSGWQYFPDVATSFSIKIGEVNVTIDRVKETDFGAQIGQIVESMILCDKSITNVELILEVTVNQRSYYEDIKQYNSIYVYYTLKDTNLNQVYLKNGLYIKTTDSIASSKLQYKITEQITDSVNEFVQSAAKVK